MTKSQANKLSVKLELQSDYYAGVWAYHDHNLLEVGDIEEATTVASAIGDDCLQKQSRGYVMPDSFTHDISKQRGDSFKKGEKTGRLASCNIGL